MFSESADIMFCIRHMNGEVSIMREVLAMASACWRHSGNYLLV